MHRCKLVPTINEAHIAARTLSLRAQRSNLPAPLMKIASLRSQ